MKARYMSRTNAMKRSAPRKPYATPFTSLFVPVSMVTLICGCAGTYVLFSRWLVHPVFIVTKYLLTWKDCMTDALHVLFVEGNEDLGGDSVLDSDDLDVTVMEEPGRALEVLGEGDIDCVVSAYDLPGLDGVEFLRRVRDELGRLPFLLYTEEGDEDVAAEAVSAGVTDYIQGDDARLLDCIRAAVENRRAERHLRDSEERYRGLVENSPNAILVHDREGIRYANSSAVELFDADSEEELEGMGMEDLVPSDVEGAGEWVHFVCEEGRVVEEQDVRVRTLGGGERYVELVGVPTTREGMPAAQLVLSDVTDRVEVEEELRETESLAEMRGEVTDELVEDLREAEERYRTVVEQNLVGIFVVQDDEFRYVNPRVEETTGYGREELMSMDPMELVDEEDREEVQERVEGVLGGEAEDQFVSYDVRRKDGELITVQAYFSETEIDGDPAVVGSVLDVTERVERERELERYETIMDVMGDGVYTIDPDARFTEVNTRVEEMTGYGREELLGEHVSLVMSEEEIRRGEEVIRELIESDGEEVGVLEMDLHTKDGEVVRCENRIALLPYDDEFRGTVGVVRDISDRLAREDELERQNERLEEFVSVVSHDLRNPLSVAQGYMELIREDPEPEYVREAEDALDRMGELIEDLLMLARQGQTVGEVEEVDLREVVDRAWSNLSSSDAELVVEENLGVVMADDGRVVQLLENLFRNAVEHAGTDVRVRVGGLEDGVMFVEDDGPGIPREERDAVFEHGYTTAKSGTGFGLSIVKRIAEAHGWTVSVAEGSEGGARFEVRD